jgi:hypothetical protein
MACSEGVQGIGRREYNRPHKSGLAVTAAHFGVVVLEAHKESVATELAVHTVEKTAIGVLVAGTYYRVLSTIVVIVPLRNTRAVKGMAFKNTPSAVKWLY